MICIIYIIRSIITHPKGKSRWNPLGAPFLGLVELRALGHAVLRPGDVFEGLAHALHAEALALSLRGKHVENRCKFVENPLKIDENQGKIKAKSRQTP